MQETAKRDGPLTIHQLQIWKAATLLPDRDWFNITFPQRARGETSADLLRCAAQALTDRHPALRTSIVRKDRYPQQRIHAEIAPAFSWLGQMQEQAFWDKAHEIARYPFDLADPPLMRLIAGRVPGDEVILVFVLHHAFGDAASIDILVEDFFDLHNRLALQQPVPPPETEASMIDIAVEERAILRSAGYEKMIAALCERVLDPAPKLPAFVRPGTDNAGGEESVYLSRVLPDAAANALRTQARNYRVTPFVLFWSLLHHGLAQRLRQPDLVYMLVHSGRFTPECLGLVGGFDDIVLARLTDDRPGAEGIMAAQMAMLEAMSAAEYPHMYFGELIAKKFPEIAEALYCLKLNFIYTPDLSETSGPLRAVTHPEDSDAIRDFGSPVGKCLSFCAELGATHIHWSLRYNPERVDVALVEAIFDDVADELMLLPSNTTAT